MRIGIIGCGIVGEATARVLEDRGYAVERHDPPKGLYAEGPFDIAFICVPTPLHGTELHYDDVWDTALEHMPGLAVVRSTLPAGALDRMSVEGRAPFVYMPCFSREAVAYEEESQAKFRVYGGEFDNCLKVAELFGDVHHAVFTDFRTAEFIKLALNAKLATDISFATEMSEAAARFGVNWGTVESSLRRDPRIGPEAYLRPGPFGGKCLPKDTTNLATQTGSRLLKAVMEVNDGNRHTVEEEYLHAAHR